MSKRLRLFLGVTGLWLAVLMTGLAQAKEVPAAAPDPALLTVAVDGKVVRFSPPPLIEEGTTLVPAVDLIRSLGGSGEWNPFEGTFRGRIGDTGILFRAGDAGIEVNGLVRPMQARSRVVDRVLFVPLRDSIEALGFRIQWYGKARLAAVMRDVPSPMPPAPIEVNGVSLEGKISLREINGELYIPARPVLEALGYQVVWQPKTGEVWFRRHGERLAFRPGDSTIYQNGNPLVEPSPPVIENGVSLLPLALFASLGEDVRWDAARWALVIKRGNPTPQAYIGKVEGRVTILRKGADRSEIAITGSRLNVGDRVRTGETSSAEITLDDGSVVEIAPSSELEVGMLGVSKKDISRAVSFRLLLGRVLARVAKLTTDYSRFEIETPTGVAGVRGTVFMVDVDEIGKSRVAVFSGKVNVRSADDPEKNTVVLKSRQETEITDSQQAPAPPANLRNVVTDDWFLTNVKDAVAEETADLLPPDQVELSDDELEREAESRVQKIKDTLDGKDTSDSQDEEEDPGDQPGKNKDGNESRNGQDAKPGQDGPNGEPGEDGQDGKPGEDGQDGKPGEDGQDGKPTDQPGDQPDEEQGSPPDLPGTEPGTNPTDGSTNNETPDPGVDGGQEPEDGTDPGSTPPEPDGGEDDDYQTVDDLEEEGVVDFQDSFEDDDEDEGSDYNKDNKDNKDKKDKKDKKKED